MADSKYLDVLGQEVYEGDIVALATAGGGLAVGKIVSITPTPDSRAASYGSPWDQEVKWRRINLRPVPSLSREVRAIRWDRTVKLGRSIPSEIFQAAWRD